MGNVDLHNEIVQKFRSKVLRDLKQNASKFKNGKIKSFVIRKDRSEMKLKNSISSKLRKNGDMAESVSFSFERHGVFVTKGVSNKHGLQNPRQKTEWIEPALENSVPELADKIAEVTANNVVKIYK